MPQISQRAPRLPLHICEHCGREVTIARCLVCAAPVPCAHWTTCSPACAAARKMTLQRERRKLRRRQAVAAQHARERAREKANLAPFVGQNHRPD